MKTNVIIFGITGDLSRRKLIPALKQIRASGQAGELAIIGVSRREVAIKELVGPELADSTTLVSMDLAEPADYQKLYQAAHIGEGAHTVVYLSVPPLAVTQIARLLGEAGFNVPGVKLLFEKPFGVDEASAKEMVTEVARYFDELAIYRIDHYLAKEMAQNIVAFRATNALFAHTWNREFIESIEVVASETIGIEARTEFYEQTGALRDVLQGHLMQLLALTILRVPDDLDWTLLPALRSEALRQLAPAVPTESVRAQYDTYRQEVNNPKSQVETYVSVTLHSHDPAWDGVPFTLTTGKALDQKTTEVRVHFRKSHDSQANCLIFHIQPNEGVEIDLYAKRPGYDRELDRRSLTFGYPEDTALPDAYEQVLVDAIRSKKSIFASGEEIVASWHVLQPLLDAWGMESRPLLSYQSGAHIDDHFQPR